MSKDTYETIFNSMLYVGPLGERSDLWRIDLAKVIERLPESARKIALERCMFTHMPRIVTAVIWPAFFTEANVGSRFLSDHCL